MNFERHGIKRERKIVLTCHSLCGDVVAICGFFFLLQKIAWQPNNAYLEEISNTEKVRGR